MSSAPTSEEIPSAEQPPQRSETLTNILVLVILTIASIVWWDFFRTPVLFVVTLGILVAVHEWGHFIAAKASGVHVYEFALGFGPKLMTYMRRGGTEYTIRAIPLGGFVNPKGMQPDDPITPDGINGRRPAERALVYLAGPLMNIILGFAVLGFMGYLVGTADESVALVGPVSKNSEASRMQALSVNGGPAGPKDSGLRIGDRILEVNGEPVTLDNVTRKITPNKGKPITVLVQRGDSRVELRGTPQEKRDERSFITVTRVPEGAAGPVQLGDQIEAVNDRTVGLLNSELVFLFTGKSVKEEVKDQPVTVSLWRNNEFKEVQTSLEGLQVQAKQGVRIYGVLGFQPLHGQGKRVSLQQSFQDGGKIIAGFFAQLAGMFSRPKQLGENVGGPVAIFGILDSMGKMPPLYYFSTLASLSLSLAVFNLLPVPVLDGGHMLLLTVEVLRRRRLEPETQRAVAMVGVALIGVLFVVILFKDIWNRFL